MIIKILNELMKVDLDFPDCEKFPKFRELQGLEAMVNPGEILYIPMYWWHHVINVEDTVAINFWHKVSQLCWKFLMRYLLNFPLSYKLQNNVICIGCYKFGC